MKYWVAIMSVLCWSSVCHATLEFSAYRRIANEASFVITDLDDRKSSEWIAVGQSFAGYTLVAFDAGTETVSVRKGSLTLDLPLKGSHVRQDEAALLSATERHQRTLARYGKNANLAVVVLRFEKESVSLTVKEVWKGFGFFHRQDTHRSRSVRAARKAKARRQRCLNVGHLNGIIGRFVRWQRFLYGSGNRWFDHGRGHFTG